MPLALPQNLRHPLAGLNDGARTKSRIHAIGKIVAAVAARLAKTEPVSKPAA